MGDFVGDVFGGLGDIVSDVAGGVKDVVSDVAGGVKDVVTGVGDVVSDIGSSLDDFVNDTVGWPTVAAVISATTGLPTNLFSTAGSAAAADAAFVAADAAQLAAQGLSQAQIASTLTSSGVQSFIAADAAALAASGLSDTAIAQNLTQSGSGLTSLFTSSQAAATAASNPSLLNKAGSILKNVLGGTGGTTGGTSTTGGSTLSGLFSAGIDAITAANIANQLKSTGTSITQQATQAGETAAVPFTPYTVTTGTGSATVSPTGATATLSPELQAIQNQLFTRANQSISAINPAQASQTLFNQLEALAQPGREVEQTRLLGSLGQKGLLGFGQNIPTISGVQTVNPYVQSLLSAQQQAQAQNALAAQQFGTSEAQRQASLGEGLLTTGTGLQTQATNPLANAYTYGTGLTQLAQTDAGRQLEATLRGLGYQVPFQTTAANIQAGQTALAGQSAKTATEAILKGIFS